MNTNSILRSSRKNLRLALIQFKYAFAVVFSLYLTGTARAQGIFDYGATAPTPGTYDISQLTSSTATAVPGINYYVDSGNPGQTFTMVNGYQLSNLFIKEVPGSAGGGMPQLSAYTLRIYQVSGTAATLLTTYISTNQMTFTQGDWVEWAGLTNILQPNTTYAYALSRNGSGWWMPAVQTGNPYSGGAVAVFPTSSGTLTFSSTSGYDAAFDLGLAVAPLAAGPTTFSPASPVFVGTPVTISASVAFGIPPYSYNWQVSMDGGVTYTSLAAGNGSSTYNLDTTGQGGTDYSYRLVVTDSESAAVTVTNLASSLLVSSTQIPPTPTTNTTIVPQSIIFGGSATMTAGFSGTALSYQWEYSVTNDGSGLLAIPGATNTTFALTNAQYNNSGYYELVAFNSVGTNNSDPTNLTVRVPVAITIGPAAGPNPAIGSYDIAQLSTTGDAGSPGANKLNYFDNNGSPPGQTFTTGSNPSGYSLANLYYKCGGPVVNNGSHGSGVVYTMRIYSMTNATAGSAVLISTYTNQNTAAAIPNNVWAQWNGMTNILAPNTAYAYSIKASSGFMHMGNASNSPAFYNGGLGLFPTGSGTVTFATPSNTSDATFLVNVFPTGFPYPLNSGILPVTSSGSPVYAGTPAAVSASAAAAAVAGSTPLYYQWLTDNGSGGATWTTLLSGTNARSPLYTTYNVNTFGLAGGTYQYELVVTNSFGSCTSAPVQLYLLASAPPFPTNQTTITPSGVYVGGTATMTAGFSGTPPISYQWYFNNGSGAVSILNATNSIYTITNAQLANSGAYFLVASNFVSPNTATSTPAEFIVGVTGQVNTSSAIISDAGAGQPGSLTPPVGSNDIAQLNYNFPTTLNVNYYVNNSSPPGQTFTTSNSPPTPSGYPLTSVFVQDEYTTEAGGVTNIPQTYTLDIYQVLNTNVILLTSYTTANAFRFTNSGDWFQIAGLTNYLQPNTTYGFSIHNNGNGYWKLGNDQGDGDLYTGGEAAIFPSSGIGAMTLPSDPTIDSTFIVHFSQPGAPALLQDTQISPPVAVDGSNVLMTAYFSGEMPINFQWEFVNANVTNTVLGATNTTYDIPAADLSNSGEYFLLAWNAAGTNASSPAPLSVIPIQLIQDTLISPSSAYTNADIPITMSAVFGGVGLTYQWMFNDGSGPVVIVGATNSTYTITNFVASQVGDYYLMASNTVDGLPERLTSTPTPLTALSTPSDLTINFSFQQPLSLVGALLDTVNPGNDYWNEIIPTAGAATNITSYADDDSTVTGINFEQPNLGGNWHDFTFSGLPLFYDYMLNDSATPTPFVLSNLPQGVYNLACYSCDGGYTGSQTAFSVAGQTNVAVTTTGASLVQNNNYVLFTNIVVTNGTFSGAWWQKGGRDGAFNGVQLQLAYSFVYPRIFVFSEPGTNTVPVGQAASIGVGAEGPGQLYYQWYYTNTPGIANGTAVVGATNSTYSPDTSTAYTNSYYAIITNSAGLIANSAVGTVSTFIPITVSWRGAVSGAWDFSSLNWSNVSQQVDGVAYTNPDYVILDDSAVDFDVSNAVVVVPSGVVVSNNLNNYVIYGTGNMGGTMSLAMNGNATLTISNNNTYAGGTIVNAGTLALAKGGSAGSLVGTVTVEPHGTVNLQVTDALGYGAGTCITNINIFGGALADISGGNEGFNTTFNLMGGTMSSTSGAYNLNGASAAINSFATNEISTITGPLALRSSGLVISTAQGTAPGGVDLSISGRISDAGGNTLTKAGNGTLSLSGVNTFNGDININGGLLRIDGSGELNSGNYTAHLFINGTGFNYNSSATQGMGQISGSGPLTLNGSGTLTLNGASDYTNTTTVNSGTLAGTGNVGGPLVVNAGGTLAPGSTGSGTLTVNSNLTLNAGSTSAFAVNGSIPANTAVMAGGAVAYGGTLNIVPVGTFSAGQQFILFSGIGATNASNFASVQGNPGNGLAFAFTNGVLSVVATVSTSPTKITSSFSGGLLTLSWPSDHIGWQLQAQTNSLSSGLGSNWINVAGTTTTNMLSVPTANNGCVFYRLIYKLP